MTDWTQANRLYLLASLNRVRNCMRRAVEIPGEGVAEIPSAGGEERAVLVAAEALPAPSTLHRLGETFGLSPFERDVLLLCAGVELDSRFAADCLGKREAGSPFPTFGQAMAALPGAHCERTDAHVLIAAMAVGRAGGGWGARAARLCASTSGSFTI